MKLMYPIKNKGADDLYRINREGKGGFYPLGADDAYHGGLHFEGNHPLVAIADGQVIAYRYKSSYVEEKVDGKTYKYSNCFVLIRHHYKSPKEQELVFYSLYHHLRPWNECKENERDAIEVFGTPGFEITASSLNVRAGMGTDENVVGSLNSSDKPAATKIDDTWARLEDGPLKGNYFAHTYNGNSYANPIVIPGDPELDDIIACNIDVKAGALIGYTGLYEAAGIGRGHKTVHVEVFAGKDAESFITNPKKEGKVSHLIVSAGTLLKKKSIQQDPTPEFTRPADCEVERIDENDDGEWIQVKDKKVLGNVAYAWLNDKYNNGHQHYTAKTAHLADMQSALPGVEIEAEAETTEETNATRFKWISHDGSDRRNIYTLPSADKAAMYWVKAASLNGNKLTGTTQCYTAPFEMEDGNEVSDEHVMPIKETVKMYYEDRLWYRVKVPGAHGWVAKDDVKEATPFDWPGFRVLEEKENTFSLFFQPEENHTADYDSLPEFFQKLVSEMDANDDGKVSREEIKLALKQKSIAHRLSRLICVHPSEWWTDNEKSFWEPLLDMLDGKSEAMEKRLENLCWWEQVKDIDGFPDSPKVYHWNPVTFVKHMRSLKTGWRAILELAIEAEPGNTSDEEILNKARKILRRWGFPTGALGIEEAVRDTTDPAVRMAMVKGESNQHIKYLQASAKKALKASETELKEREAVFSGDGKITRTTGGTERTVQIVFSSDVADWAAGVGVVRAEALAKIHWKLWDAVLDAAFETQGVELIKITGAWRPYSGLNSYQGNLNGISNVPNGAGGYKSWNRVMQSPHIKGRGLDISTVNTDGVYASTMSTPQPNSIKNLSINLKNSGKILQIIQPWMMYGVSSSILSTPPSRVNYGNGFIQNGLTHYVETSHNNHIHLTSSP